MVQKVLAFTGSTVNQFQWIGGFIVNQWLWGVCKQEYAFWKEGIQECICIQTDNEEKLIGKIVLYVGYNMVWKA